MVKYWVKLFFLVGVGAMCACQQKEIQTVSEQKVDLKIGVLPITPCLPFYIAQEQGIYDSLGIHVRLISYTSTADCFEALRKGKIDGSYTDLMHYLCGVQSGDSLELVAQFADDWQLLTNKNLRMRSLERIEERLVALSRCSVSDYVCDQIADSIGVLSEQIFRPQVNDLFIRYQMVDGGQVDAAVLPQPMAQVGIYRGMKSLYAFRRKKNAGLGCLVLGRYQLENKTEKLLEGYNQAADRINNGLRADSILVNVFRVPAQYVDSVKIAPLSYWEKKNEKKLEEIRRWAVRRGFIQRDSKTR